MTTLAELIDALRRLHLLDDAQIEALRRPGQPTDARALAKQLVRDGWLSAFQVNRLFTGRGDELLLGSYVLLDLLGEGGMGAVYKARNWKLGHIVAVKLIRKSRLTSDAAVRRFHREIRASAQLDHAHIVRAIDADAVGGVHFLVMEYVEGGQDLHRHVKEHGPLPIAEACTYIRQAALGLQQAYERGLVHRDIKPHNLLLTGATVKILDFGLARLGESSEDSTTLTQEGTVMGTLDYIAPEQARDSHRADIRADLYSLGCTLYFLLSGRAPFAGGAAAQKMYRHQCDEPARIELLRPDVPPALGDVVRTLMAKRPEHRYQTPAALAVDLEAVLSNQAVTALPRDRQSRSGSESSLTVPVADSPFAHLSQSETFAQGPTTERAAVPVVAKRPHRYLAWALAVGGVLTTGLVVIVIAALFLRGGPPPKIDDAPIPPSAAKRPAAPTAATSEDKLRKLRAADAEAALKQLRAKVTEPGVTFASFALQLRKFRAQHAGTPSVMHGIELLTRLKSPLDVLDPAQLSADCIEHWRRAGRALPAELVAVLGVHGRRHWGAARCVAYQPGGKLIASGGADGAVRFWDVETGRLTRVLAAQERGVDCLAFSPDGTRLATGCREGGTVGLVWNLADREAPRTIAAERIWSLAFSPDGKMLAYGNEYGDLRLADSDSLKLRWTTKPLKNGRVRSIAFSGDGRLLAVACWSPLKTPDGKQPTGVFVLDVATGEQRRRCAADGAALEAVAISFNGSRILSAAADGAVRLWDGATGRELEKPNGHTAAVTGVAFAFGEAYALSSGEDGAIHVWDMKASRPLCALRGHRGAVHGAAFSPDGRQVASAGADGTIGMWDVETAREVGPVDKSVTGLAAFAPDAMSLALVRGDRVEFLDCTRWQPKGSLPNQPKPITAAAYLPHAPLLLTVGDDETVKTWDTASREEKTVWKLPGQTFLGASPDGSRTAWRAGHDVVTLRDSATERDHLRLQTAPRKWVYEVAFAPDGRTVAVAYGEPGWGSVRTYDTATGRELFNLNEDFNAVGHVRYSPDGRRLAAYGWNPVIYVWDATTGVRLRTVDAGRPGVPNDVTGAEFSIDGKHLLYCNRAGQLVVADAATGMCLDALQMPGPIISLAVAPDGRHIAIVNGDGTLYILRLTDAAKPPAVLSAVEARQQQVATATHLRVNATVENTIGMKLELIPPGRFLMGSPATEAGRGENEGPQHPVRISRPFYLGALEVTVGQFKQFVQATGYRTEAEKSGEGALRYDFKVRNDVMDATCTWRTPGIEQNDAHPVVCVNVNDAAAFCAWLTRREGQRYRLPTEAEWEYACRAGTQSVFPFGNDPQELDRYAWIGKLRQGKTVAVGKLQANAWGLFDMLGNAWEFCLDGPRTYGPECVVDPRGPMNGPTIVIRGECVHPGATDPGQFRSARRFGGVSSSMRATNIGFRILREIDGNAP